MDIRMFAKQEAAAGAVVTAAPAAVAEEGERGSGPDTAPETVAVARAARELELKRGEFELAAQLGHVRTTVVSGAGRRVPGRREVEWREIERLRSAEGFPDVLRERVRTVGTAEGAGLMAISTGRFTRLAKAGYLTPVKFYLNRYRAVVWLYLADELTAFAAREEALLVGRFPRTLTAGRDPDDDVRPRNWRGRRIGHLLHLSEDPWERAAITGSVLDPVQRAELVADPYERAYLSSLQPDLAHGRSDSEAALAAVRPLLLADHPDEISWHRASLTALLDEARRARPAPRPDRHGDVPSRPLPEAVRDPEPEPEAGFGLLAPGSDGDRVFRPAAVHEPLRRGSGKGLLTRLRLRKEKERDPGRPAGRERP
ncbi:DUF6397 family protein [Streptomyces sp. NPDC006638]|uniref:DUF6397 family protein n=1 Tax=Streptomyces sp. NPDC006638 TaxID=3157183 RepID=UPI0033BFA0DF